MGGVRIAGLMCVHLFRKCCFSSANSPPKFREQLLSLCQNLFSYKDERSKTHHHMSSSNDRSCGSGIPAGHLLLLSPTESQQFFCLPGWPLSWVPYGSSWLVQLATIVMQVYCLARTYCKESTTVFFFIKKRAKLSKLVNMQAPSLYFLPDQNSQIKSSVGRTHFSDSKSSRAACFLKNRSWF